MNTVEVKHLYKSFGDKVVLRDFSARFPLGAVTAVMAPSGGGKTTLLRILMGLEAADSGTVEGLAGLRQSAVFQEDRLCEALSAAANIRLVNPALSKGEAEAMLRELGLGDSLGQPVRTLSGGMKRRVAILRALAAEYDVLFCDEPFKGLDQATKAQVLDYFLARTQGKTVLVVTHDPEEAKSLGGHTLLL